MNYDTGDVYSKSVAMKAVSVFWIQCFTLVTLTHLLFYHKNMQDKNHNCLPYSRDKLNTSSMKPVSKEVLFCVLLSMSEQDQLWFF